MNKNWLVRGVRDGIPIALGYFAVSFSLGIAARNAGLTAFQAMLASFTNNASAGADDADRQRAVSPDELRAESEAGSQRIRWPSNAHWL